MASWTDGAAYAPIERPDGFATPEAAPLEVAVPLLAQTPGPIPPPQSFQPSAPQAPLDQVRTDPPPSRNPSEPFHVASATMTAGPDVAAVSTRDPLLPFETATTTAGPGQLPPPTGAPLALDQLPPPGAPVPPGQFAQPRTPAVTAEVMKTLRTLLILALVALGIGFLLPGAAPWLVLMTGLLGLRTKPLTGAMGTTAVVAGVSLLLLGLAAPDSMDGFNRMVCLGLVCWAGYGLSRKPRSPR